MRLFVALWPTPPVIDALVAVPRPEHPDLRWTTADQWHVTLRFLGEVDPGARPDLEDSLAGVAAAQRAADVALGPASARLGSGLLVLPAAGADELALAVTEATRGVGRPPEDRAFRGHLTLARARRERRVPIDIAGHPLEVGWTATSVALVVSHLGPGGARYETLASWSLTSAPA